MAECMDSTINNTNTPKQSIAIVNNDINEESKTDKENGSTALDKIGAPEATSLGTTGRIPDHNGCNGDTVMVPILIEEMKGDSVPRSFKKIYTTLVKEVGPLNNNEYFFLLIHVLMLECGFITLECREHYDDRDYGFNVGRILDCVEKLPPNWKRSDTIYISTYILPPFVDTTCKVVCAVCGDDIVVNSSVDIIDVKFSFLIDPSRHVIKSAVQIANKFQDMRLLSLIFKTTIGNPAKIAIMRHNNIPAFCLQDLPAEILWNIMRHFDPKMLAKFERTCRRFRVLSHDPALWKQIPGGKWESFQFYKRNENARLKYVSCLRSRSNPQRRLD